MKKLVQYSLAITLVLIASTLPLQATAASNFNDIDKPIEIAADTLEVMQDQGLAIFQGEVQAKQGRLVLKAEKLEVHYGKTQSKGAQGSFDKLIAQGNVFVASPRETVRGQKAHYDVKKGIITLEGDVMLTRDKNVVRGNKLTLDLRSGRTRFEGQAGSGRPGERQRVRGLFVPPSK